MNETKPALLIVADEWEPMQVLTASLQDVGEYQVTHVAREGPDHDLTQFGAIFVYVHRPLAAHVEDALIDYALDGGRLIVLHHAIASAKVANPKWLDFLGIYIAQRDDPAHPWRVVNGTHTVVNLQPNHYITTHGVTYDRTIEYHSSDAPSLPGRYPALELTETEVFLNQQFTDGREKTVLFGFQIADPESGELYMQDRSGWYKAVGQGWLFYLQPGHAASDFQNPNFAQIVLNCLQWQPGMVGTTATSLATSATDESALTETTTSRLAAATAEWLSIAPGPNLEGWQEYPWPPGNQVADAPLPTTAQWHMDPATGTLRCDGTTHTHLLTQELYRDFVLQLEWRFLDAAAEHYNSGVFVRMVSGQRVMHQIETRKNKVGVIMGGTLVDGVLTYLGVAQPGRAGQWKAVWPHIPRAWREHVVHTHPTPVTQVPPALGPSVPTVVHPPGAWNHYEITCIGPTIVVRTNGTVSSITDNCQVREGAIGFESEGYAIEFRKIRVQSIQ
ncbi:MAG: DUF1080 domain-containing protein [Caldilineaceae bacterium]|nr:DUF1080 domain-containing protein [Caldilineaceae bacterium]